MVIKRDVFDSVGFFDERPVLKGSEDWDMWLRIVRKYRVDFLNETLACYREHESSISRNIEMRIACIYDVISRYVLNDKNVSQSLKKRCLSKYHAKIANHYVLNGNMKKARTEILKSLSYTPLDIKLFKIFVKTLFGQKMVFFLRDLSNQMTSYLRD